MLRDSELKQRSARAGMSQHAILECKWLGVSSVDSDRGSIVALPHQACVPLVVYESTPWGVQEALWVSSGFPQHGGGPLRLVLRVPRAWG